MKAEGGRPKAEGKEESRYLIIPYAVVDGVASLRPSLLRDLFRRMQADRLDRWIFHDGSVATAEDFVALATSAGVHFFAVYDTAPDKRQFAALVFLTNYVGESALVHHCYFRDYWGEPAREIGRQVFDFLLGMQDAAGRMLYPVILGLTPANNRLGVRFAEAMGGRIAATIPEMFWDAHAGRRVGAVLSYITREIAAEHRGRTAAPRKEAA